MMDTMLNLVIRQRALLVALCLPAALAIAQGTSPVPAAQQAQHAEQPATPPAYAGVPPLVQTTPPLELGYQKPKTMAAGEIVLLNNGDHRLKITRIKPDCACTDVYTDKRELAPGETTTLNVGVDVPREIGPVRRDIRIECEGYALPYVTSVNLEAGFAVRVNGGASAAIITDKVGMVKLDSVDKKPFRVLAINGEAPDFLGDAKALNESRTQFNARYDWSDTDGASIPRWMIIETDHPDARMFSVRARIGGATILQFRSKWHVVEERVLLGSFPGESSAKSAVTLSGKPLIEGQRITITSSNGKIPVRVTGMRKPDQGGGILAEIEATPIAGYRGFFWTVVSFTLEGETASFDLFGRVLEPNEKAVPPSE